MIKFRQIEPNELTEYTEFFSILSEIYSDENFVVNIALVDGKKNVLFKGLSSETYSLFTLKDENDYDYVFFKLDEENKIQSIGDDTYLITDINDNPSYFNVETECYERLVLQKRTNGDDVDGYDGLICYIQYSTLTDEMAIIAYQQMYNQQEKVYDIHLKNPFIYQIVLKASKNQTKIANLINTFRKFIRIDFDTRKSMLGYKIFLLKEHGLEKFFSEKKYVIDRNQSESRYFRVLGTNSNGFTIHGFPFMPHYSQQEMEERFVKKGFLTEVPRILLDCHNEIGQNELQMYCQRVVDSFLEYEKNLNKDDVLTLSYSRGGNRG